MTAGTGIATTAAETHTGGAGGGTSVASSSPWRAGVAAGEGVRSALAGRWPSAVLVLLVCWLGALPGAGDAVMVADLVTEEQRFLDAGGNVVVVENRDAGVPVAACERLADVDGVAGSAALTRMAEPVTVSAARGGDLAVFAATAGIWSLLDVQASPARAGIVPDSAAERLGLADGDWIQFERSPGTQGRWVPVEPARVTVADMGLLGDAYTGVLLPAVDEPDATADGCVVAAEPAQLDALAAVLPAVLDRGYGQVVVRDRLFTGEFSADYSASYQQRPLQWAWVAAGALLGLVWLLLRWVRRGDDALYATMGADIASRVLLRGTEWTVLAGLGGVWAVTLGVTGAMAGGASYTLALTYVGRHAGAALLVATAVVLLAQLRRPRSLLADLKDR